MITNDKNHTRFFYASHRPPSLKFSFDERIVMRLHGSNTDAIEVLQRQFKACFPFLKIEFTSTGHSLYKASPPASIYKTHFKIGDIRKKKDSRDVDIELTGDLTVGELEQQLAGEYGLFVQVFRKSGNTWVETTLTDKWTLEQQNSHGDEISNFKPESPYNKEYDADTF